MHGDLRESTGRGSDLGSPGTRQLPPWGHQRRLGSESVLSSPTDSDATPSRYQQVSQEIVCQSDFAQIFHFARCLITCHIPLIFRPIVSYAFLADGFLFFFFKRHRRHRKTCPLEWVSPETEGVNISATDTMLVRDMIDFLTGAIKISLMSNAMGRDKG